MILPVTDVDFSSKELPEAMGMITTVDDSIAEAMDIELAGRLVMLALVAV